MEIEIKGKVVLIDDEDWNKVKGYRWTIDKQKNLYYVTATLYINGNKETVRMHRVITGCNKGDGLIVDHINHNTLDNRKTNLRVCDIAENTRNQQKHKNSLNPYKGIKYSKRDKKWIARIQYNKKRIYVGCNKDPIEAAKAYDRKAIELHGEFAYTNFPKENYIKEGATEWSN